MPLAEATAATDASPLAAVSPPPTAGRAADTVCNFRACLSAYCDVATAASVGLLQCSRSIAAVYACVDAAVAAPAPAAVSRLLLRRATEELRALPEQQQWLLQQRFVLSASKQESASAAEAEAPSLATALTSLLATSIDRCLFAAAGSAVMHFRYK